MSLVITPDLLARIAGAAAGKIVVSDGTTWTASTPTFPNASATTRKIIASDGTNWVASTETWPVPGVAANRLISDGTNWTAGMPVNVLCYVKNITNLTSGAPADIATITIPAGITRWRTLGSAGTNSLATIITETQTGSPAAGTIALFNSTGGGGTQIMTTTAPANGAGTGVGWQPSLTALQTGNTMTVRQIVNSANSATLSFYIGVAVYP